MNPVEGMDAHGNAISWGHVGPGACCVENECTPVRAEQTVGYALHIQPDATKVSELGWLSGFTAYYQWAADTGVTSYVASDSSIRHEVTPPMGLGSAVCSLG
jgi:hypothetical protein